MMIYKAINCLNDKVYFCVSSDENLNNVVSIKLSGVRAKPKKMKLKDAYMGKTPFQKAVLRYGEHNFKFEVLHSRISQKKAYSLKKNYIKKYKSMDPEYGYNCTTGGKYFKNAEHTNQRMSQANTGKTMPESYVELMKARVGELHNSFGSKRTQEQKETMRQAQLDSDYVQTEETQQKKRVKMQALWKNPTEQMKKDSYNKKHQIGSRDVRGEKNPMYGKGLKGKANGMYGRTGASNPNYGKPIPQSQKDIISRKNKAHAQARKILLIKEYSQRTEKACRNCKEIKSLDMFCRITANLDGLNAICKPCDKIRKR